MQTFNIKQAAEFLCMSSSALREKVKKGEINASKPGRRWVFIEDDLVT